MSNFLISPKFQAFDSNGDPLSGGLLYTYAPGTTTNKATYPTIADATAQTNANANPIVLDSRGECSIVLRGETKLVLKTSAGVTIWTVDNNEPGNTTDVVDSNGNEVISFVGVASAINEVTLTNAAIGNPPIISSTGDDTNIGINIVPKGTGAISLKADTINLTDSTGNEIVKLVDVASAVNELSFSNAATASNPIAEATGDATNIGIDIKPKGTGVVRILGTSTASAELRLLEDTDNGTNYLGFKAPAALTASTTFTLPDGDGTADQVLKTNASGTLSWANGGVAASTTVAGIIEIAVQSEMETGTSTSLAVCPGNQQYHPSASKGWAYVTWSGGTPTLAANYNVSSIVDSAQGVLDVNWNTDFAGIVYAPVIGVQASGSTGFYCQYSSIAAASIRVEIRTDSLALADPPSLAISGFGDQ